MSTYKFAFFQIFLIFLFFTPFWSFCSRAEPARHYPRKRNIRKREQKHFFLTAFFFAAGEPVRYRRPGGTPLHPTVIILPQRTCFVHPFLKKIFQRLRFRHRPPQTAREPGLGTARKGNIRCRTAKTLFPDCNSISAALKPVLYRHAKGIYETGCPKHFFYMSFFKKSVILALLSQGTARIISQKEGICQLFFGEGGVGR